MTPPSDLRGLDETYAKMALRILVGPRDLDWHNTATELLDSAPSYGFPHEDGEMQNPRDVFEVAGRILGYCCGIVEWNPED